MSVPNIELSEGDVAGAWVLVGRNVPIGQEVDPQVLAEHFAAAIAAIGLAKLTVAMAPVKIGSGQTAVGLSVGEDGHWAVRVGSPDSHG